MRYDCDCDRSSGQPPNATQPVGISRFRLFPFIRILLPASSSSPSSPSPITIKRHRLNGTGCPSTKPNTHRPQLYFHIHSTINSLIRCVVYADIKLYCHNVYLDDKNTWFVLPRLINVGTILFCGFVCSKITKLFIVEHAFIFIIALHETIRNRCTTRESVGVHEREKTNVK